MTRHKWVTYRGYRGYFVKERGTTYFVSPRSQVIHRTTKGKKHKKRSIFSW